MTVKFKFPKFYRSTKSTAIIIKPSVNYANVLYIESMIMLFEKIDDGTAEMLRQKANDYLEQYGNNYEEAKKHLFADFENQVNKYADAFAHLAQSQNTKL